jgi:hypothetical protein
MFRPTPTLRSDRKVDASKQPNCPIDSGLIVPSLFCHVKNKIGTRREHPDNKNGGAELGAAINLISLPVLSAR